MVCLSLFLCVSVCAHCSPLLVPGALLQMEDVQSRPLKQRFSLAVQMTSQLIAFASIIFLVGFVPWVVSEAYATLPVDNFKTGGMNWDGSSHSQRLYYVLVWIGMQATMTNGSTSVCVSVASYVCWQCLWLSFCFCTT